MKTSLRNLVLFVFIFSFTGIYCQTVDTIAVFSNKMGKEIKNVLILPKNYSKDSPKPYPVLYLLHGYGGKHDSWIGMRRDLPVEASKFDVIIVCPDGKNGWYWDSPVNPASQFDTYVSKELVGYMDANYNTVKSNKGRAITGLSMGGHGGLWLGINHPDIFGACGSMSGGVDIRPFPNNWDMKKQLGSYKDYPENWDKYTVIEQLHKIEPGTLSIIFDCGTDDFFYEVNENLHRKMLLNNIQHDYIVRPGRHDGNYWKNAIDYQLLFFTKFFGR
ncbi:alpha/beta hydrolase [Viscerimonas tarda]